jgi:hypothetical protein
MTPNLRCHHDMTGADVASSAKQPSPKQRWRESFADPSGEACAATVLGMQIDGVTVLVLDGQGLFTRAAVYHRPLAAVLDRTGQPVAA